MFIKTKSHQPAGEYKPTGIDAAKKPVAKATGETK
jgi:hypothetical protein